MAYVCTRLRGSQTFAKLGYDRENIHYLSRNVILSKSSLKRIFKTLAKPEHLSSTSFVFNITNRTRADLCIGTSNSHTASPRAAAAPLRHPSHAS